MGSFSIHDEILRMVSEEPDIMTDNVSKPFPNTRFIHYGDRMVQLRFATAFDGLVVNYLTTFYDLLGRQQSGYAFELEIDTKGLVQNLAWRDELEGKIKSHLGNPIGQDFRGPVRTLLSLVKQGEMEAPEV